MDFNTHMGVAKAHFRIAEEHDAKFVQAKDEAEKRINRIVAAQNYFYAAINVIEAIFARDLEHHSFNHENRFRTVIENSNIFTDEIVQLYEKVERDERNKVAYRGENGPKYQNIKKLAKILMSLI